MKFELIGGPGDGVQGECSDDFDDGTVAMLYHKQLEITTSIDKDELRLICDAYAVYLFDEVVIGKERVLRFAHERTRVKS